MKKLFTLLALALAGTLQAQVTSPAPYCNADFDDDPFNVDDAINSVTLGTLSNNSGGQYAFPHYVYYSNLTAPDLTAGGTATLTVTFNVAGGCGWGAWIDFNQNNTFEAGEKVAGTNATTSLNFGSNTSVTATIAIPTGALAGNTRMRIRIVEDDDYSLGPNGYAIMPCNAGTSATDIMNWGETEDYKVNIVTGGGGTGGGGTPPPNPTGLDFMSNRTVGFTNTNFTLSDNNFKSPTGRRWIFIPNNVIYQAATNEGSARPIVRFTDTGTYAVKLVTTFPGGKDSAERDEYIRISPFPSGVVPLEGTAFGFFPNPATGVVNFTQALHNANLAVTNVMGVTVYQAESFSGATLDMRSYADGIYFLRITQANETVTQKLILKK